MGGIDGQKAEPKISKRTKLNWTFIKRFLLMPQVPARTHKQTHTQLHIHKHTHTTGRRCRLETKSKWQRRQMRAIIVLSEKFYWPQKRKVDFI